MKFDPRSNKYRAEKESLYVLLSNSQAGQGRNFSQPRTKTFSQFCTDAIIEMEHASLPKSTKVAASPLLGPGKGGMLHLGSVHPSLHGLIPSQNRIRSITFN